MGTRRGLASPKSHWAEGRNGWVGRRSASGGGSRVSQMLRWTRRQERKCARNRTRLPVTTAADQTVAAPESGKPPLPRKPCLASSALIPKNLPPPRLSSLLRPEFTSLNQGEPQRQASQTRGTRRQKATISDGSWKTCAPPPVRLGPSAVSVATENESKSPTPQAKRVRIRLGDGDAC